MLRRDMASHVPARSVRALAGLGRQGPASRGNHGSARRFAARQARDGKATQGGAGRIGVRHRRAGRFGLDTVGLGRFELRSLRVVLGAVPFGRRGKVWM